MPKLYCEPTYGLANRLMMIVSAIRLAKKWDYDLVVVWKDDHCISCDYSAIFGDQYEHITDSPSIPPYPTDLYSRGLINPDRTKEDDLYIKSFHFVLALDDLKIPPAQITNELKQSWNEIIPSNQVLEKYQHQSFDLGIHIRRPTIFDTPTNWTSPSDLFISNISKNYIINHNIKSIYLCSPSPETTSFLTDAFADLNLKVITSISNSWGIDNPSLVQAYVDMLNLASCKHIIRHYLSTFSALPSLVSADSEMIYTDEEQVSERQPLILSGAAL